MVWLRENMSKKFTILCVEDNPDTQRMLTFLLTKAGYDVITADDGMQAIQKAKAWRPALILMDMMMPRMSGAETIRRLRQVKVTKDVPILVLSAYQEQALIDEALEAGADDFLIKTVLPEDLTDIIDKYLEIGSAVLSKRSVRIRDQEEEQC
jgi:two-component system alkaline phosphatase synthesis response regulator PhoP